MTLNALGIEVPTGGDEFDHQGDMVAMGLSFGGRLIVPVATVAARNALATSLGAGGLPLYVTRADAPKGANLEVTYDGSTWYALHTTAPVVSGALIGTYAGQPILHRYITQTVTPNASGDFVLMNPADYGTSGGVLHGTVFANSTFDIRYTVRPSAGILYARAFNTTGTAVTSNHGYSADIAYWLP